jgi:hypothetical protein
MSAISSHLLIRSTQLILVNQLSALKWVKLKTDRPSTFYSIDNANRVLEGMLFELNHVRVNPMLDNTRMIAKLTDALTEIGVTICNQPHKTSMAICYKPMGEIKDNVQFYLNKEKKLVFLSPTTRPRLIYSKPKA